MNRKAIIFGIKGYKLSKKERFFFKKNKPWGIILFSRNVKDIYQLRKLTNDIKSIFNHKNYPILMDVEGGKVSRLNKIIDLSVYSQSFFEKLYLKDKKLFLTYYKVYIDSVSSILKSAGININATPVLDIRRKKSHNIIGSRSFSKQRNNVIKLGNICINFYKRNKIGNIIKHIPGHGLSKSDSHFRTPVINAKRAELIKKDFAPFRFCKALFAMTAHVIYKTYDPINTATHSKIVINKIIRKYIKFRGVLISDDISMKSLKFSLEENAIKALMSGCNLVLHCNGNIKEMIRVAKVVPKIDKFTEKKTSDFYNFLG